jgi:hypothetical protein
MQTEAFEPAGSSGAGCTATLTATGAVSVSVALVDPAGRGVAGASNKVLVVNTNTGVAFVRFTKGASTALATDFPILPGAYKVIKINPNADTFSAILGAAGTLPIYAVTGDGL